MAKMSSVGSFFEKRGDPMVSPREGRESYNRLLEIEDADYDADRQKKTSKFWDRKIAEDLSRLPTIAAKPEVIEDTPAVIAQRRARNIIRKYNSRLGRL